MTTNYKEVTKTYFGKEMLTWENHDVSPLEVIGLYEHHDDYLPTIQKYAPDSTEEVVFILSGSFPSRQAALNIIGAIWDLSEANIKVEVDI
jgi:hypothetical protein